MARTEATVTTQDAHPTASPYRISAQPGKNIASVTLSFESDEGVTRAWRIVHQAAGRKSPRLAGQGVVCGLDRCGTGRVLARTDPVDVEITQAQLGGEGDYPLDVWALDRQGGWA